MRRDETEICNLTVLAEQYAADRKSAFVDVEDLVCAALSDLDSETRARLLRLGCDIGHAARDPQRQPVTRATAPRRLGGPGQRNTKQWSNHARAVVARIAARRPSPSETARETLQAVFELLDRFREGDDLRTSLEERGLTEDVLHSSRSEATTETLRRALPFRVVIEDESNVPIFQQIIDQFQEGIATGRLEPGARVPTVRYLADSLNIAPGTVARAYAQLESRGHLASDGARGTRIAERRPSHTAEADATELRHALRKAVILALARSMSARDLHNALDQILLDMC